MKRESLTGGYSNDKMDIRGTATDIDGKFNFWSTSVGHDEVGFSFVGMQNYELRILKKKTEYNVVMKSDTKALDDVVVTGFFTKKRRVLQDLWKRWPWKKLGSIQYNSVSAISMLTLVCGW